MDDRNVLIRWDLTNSEVFLMLKRTILVRSVLEPNSISYQSEKDLKQKENVFGKLDKERRWN